MNMDALCCCIRTLRPIKLHASESLDKNHSTQINTEFCTAATCGAPATHMIFNEGDGENMFRVCGADAFMNRRQAVGLHE